MNLIKKLPKISKKKLIIGGLILIVAVFLLSRFASPKPRDTQAEISYETEQAARRDITSALTGSGTLSAANSYTVTSMVEGEILEAAFEEGDVVEKDSILYQIDSSDAASSIETSEMSLASSQRSYNNALEDLANLNIKAPDKGILVELNVDVGDKVNNGQTIGVLRDSSIMTLSVEFPADEAKNFYKGQTGSVTLDGSFETLSATVSHIGTADQVTTGNAIVRTVELEVHNPGGISTGQRATAEINGIGSSTNAMFEYRAELSISAEVSGTVASISAHEGDWLDNDQTILTLQSDDLADSIQSQADSLRRAEISLENAKKTLENYTITSPISGTIIDKNYKAGETAEQGQTLCTIYDLSYLTLTLSVDELDIATVEVGQRVTVTADAVEGRSYTGEVTKVSVVGATSGGYTSYPVTIRIDDTEGLRPGMNVDATIVMESASDVLTMPISALNRGNAVLITSDSPSAANAVEGMEAPEGYVYVRVETGTSDDDYIEVISGLQEGDTVAYIQQAASGNEMTQMGMMPGAMPQGGGMPGGGGMPSGGGPGGGF